ncbi:MULTISPECIES: hypothetical protein [unclassified Streptomyces]|uniref:hypothetical protein n=1 Tax=unclassified Streptomyces TaxID=2593676 RepID=UPI002E17B6CA
MNSLVSGRMAASKGAGVEPVAVLGAFQRRVREVAAVEPYVLMEVHIDGRLDQDGVAGRGEGLDDGLEGGDDARRRHHPVARYLPTEALGLPVEHGVEIAVGRAAGIAEDSVVDGVVQRVEHRLRGLEVGVRDPHRQGLRRGLVGGQEGVGEGPLHGVRARAVDDGVEGGGGGGGGGG